MAQLRASFRMVSTPECRVARAASDARCDEADHLQSYFFTDLSAIESFNELSVALRNAGRAPYLLPLVERGVYRVDGMAADAHPQRGGLRVGPLSALSRPGTNG
jgi:hypothetical protein